MLRPPRPEGTPRRRSPVVQVPHRLGSSRHRTVARPRAQGPGAIGEFVLTRKNMRSRRALPVALAGVLAAGTVAVLLPGEALAGADGDGHGYGHGWGWGHGPGGHQNVIFINDDCMAAAHREAGRLDQVGF